MSDISSRGYANPDKLVSTAWVAQHLNDADVRVIESNEDPLLYPSGHVPGAVEVDWVKDLNDPLRRDYLDKSGFEALASRIGITPETTVVFYGDKSNWWATYALWVFELFGHSNSRIMDGGRLKWVEEGRELTREKPSISPTSYSAPERDDSQIRAFRDGVLSHIGENGQLVDVRSPGEFAGDLLHIPGYPQEGAVRGGHIPGASSCPWSRAANDDDTFKDAAQLRAIYNDELGLDSSASDHRLLPHRRAQQPYLVRLDLPAWLQRCAQLRWLMDGMGQQRRLAYREVINIRTGGEGLRASPQVAFRSGKPPPQAPSPIKRVWGSYDTVGSRVDCGGRRHSCADAYWHTETIMASYPPKLQEYLDDFGFISSREDRVDFLIDIADAVSAGAGDHRQQTLRRSASRHRLRIRSFRLGDRPSGRHA